MQTLNTKFPSFLESLEKQILVLDGAMGTTLFTYNLTEEDYGGKEYDGCPEHLNFTQPQIIQEIHRKFFEAGADIVAPSYEGHTLHTQMIVVLA